MGANTFLTAEASALDASAKVRGGEILIHARNCVGTPTDGPQFDRHS